MKNVFRSEYRLLSDEEKAMIELIKDNAQHLYDLICHVEDPRYQALAKTALEESIMWAVKGMTK